MSGKTLTGVELSDKFAAKQIEECRLHTREGLEVGRGVRADLGVGGEEVAEGESLYLYSRGVTGRDHTTDATIWAGQVRF